MNVMEGLCRKLESQKLHMTLLDPDDQTPEAAARISGDAAAAGTDAIMLGGSTGVTQELLDATVIAIKEANDLPVILFPTEAKAVSLRADAIYFMSLLNSRNPKFLLGEQMKAAALIKKSGLEPIAMGYIIIEPGMRAGMVGEAELIRRDDIESAVGYSVAGELLGMKLIYLEAGSGAPEPVPAELIKGVKKAIDIPLIVGGGIRSPEQAGAAVKAGADIIVTGTVVEEEGISDRFRNIVRAVKS
ncbi:MAG: geranylgeranylglyceryl/heptaprenylglyceryl phosphate synthase [Thermoplasmata archaeon]